MPIINLIDALDAEDGAPGLAVLVVFDTPKAFLDDDFQALLMILIQTHELLYEVCRPTATKCNSYGLSHY